MIKAFALSILFNGVVTLGAMASPGEDLLVSKLPKSLRSAPKVQEAPLVEATKEAIAQDRGLAPQIAGAAVRRAEDCPAVESVVRTALRGLAPTPTEMEAFAITRAAIGNAAENQGVTTNDHGDRIAENNCTEGILAAAAAEYPQFAGMLNDSGKQIAGKSLADGKEPGIGAGQDQPDQGIGNAPNIGSPVFPAAVILPSSSTSVVNRVTPTF